jgi:hypothetical protein
MNKFYDLMDDLKVSLLVSVDNKGIFIPALIKMGVNVVLVIIFYFVVFVLLMGVGLSLGNLSEAGESFNISGILIACLIASFIYVVVLFIFNLILDTGNIYIIKKVLNGEKASKQLFFEGVKKYFWTMFGTNLLIVVILALLSLFIIVGFAIYIMVGGVLTGGVALIVLPYLFYPFLATWVVIAIDQNTGGIEGLKIGLVIGKRNYAILLFFFAVWGSFVSYTMSMGGLLSMVLIPFATAILPIYFFVALMLNMRRYYSTSQNEYEMI